MKLNRNFCTAAILLVSAMLMAGCSSNQTAAVGENEDQSSTTASHGDHSGWWCVEHAIPEEECSMCSAAAAKEFREKGDWCDEHNRAESQCFKCDPSRAEKYAKLYEAKYGEAPPEPTE